MIIIKSYTDIEQSKKLAEILPLKSADMHYARVKDEEYDWIPLLSPIPKLCAECIENIPCWSLAALISVLPQFIEFKGNKYYLRFMKEYVEYANDGISIPGKYLYTISNDNLVDVCYEMILKLHELKIL